MFRLDKSAFMTEIGCSVKLSAATRETGVMRPCGEGGLSNDSAEEAEVRWSSENTDIAVVDENGNVTALSDGDTVVIAGNAKGETARCTVSVGYKGQNPILPPTWGLFIADGEPHVFDGRMYIYGSRDNPFGRNSEGKVEFCSSDYHVIYSDDLIHWTDAGVSISVEDFPPELRIIDERHKIDYLWAPDLFRSPDGKFYLTFCSGGSGGTYFIAESGDPAGPFGNVRRITYNGERISGIDPGVLTDDDGKVYIVLPSPFRIGELDPAAGYASIKEGSIVSVQELVAESPDGYYGFEGPSLRKFNGRYYFIYIAAKLGTGLPVRMNYLVSDNIRDGWRFGGTIIDMFDYLAGINVHGSVEFFGGNYYLSYHRCVPGLSEKLGPEAYLSVTREMCLERLEMLDDGSFKRAVTTSSGAKGAFKRGEWIPAGAACVFSGGRFDVRYVHRGSDVPGKPYQLRFSGWAYAWFDREGQWNGFRYVDLTGCSEAVLSVRTEATGAGIDVKELDSGLILASFNVVNTRGEWMEFRAPLEQPLTGGRSVSVGLRRAPDSGRVEFDWIGFV